MAPGDQDQQGKPGPSKKKSANMASRRAEGAAPPAEMVAVGDTPTADNTAPLLVPNDFRPIQAIPWHWDAIREMLVHP